jgi:hypothetical protein
LRPIKAFAGAVLLIWAIPALAQQAAPAALSPPAASALAARETLAQKRAAEWETLAKGVEGKIARMLPCDSRVRGAIEEVSHASQARLAALNDYLQAAAVQAKADAERARTAPASLDSLAKDADVERTEAEQQRAALDAQIADLKESARQRQDLDDPAAKLAEIRAMTAAQVDRWQQEAARRVALGGALANLAAAYEARQKAMSAELAALREETARWVDYYTARLNRAEIECSITNQARPAQRKKQ